jgi:hypothetical protein
MGGNYSQTDVVERPFGITSAPVDINIAGRAFGNLSMAGMHPRAVGVCKSDERQYECR